MKRPLPPPTPNRRAPCNRHQSATKDAAPCASRHAPPQPRRAGVVSPLPPRPARAKPHPHSTRSAARTICIYRHALPVRHLSAARRHRSPSPACRAPFVSVMSLEHPLTQADAVHNPYSELIQAHTSCMSSSYELSPRRRQKVPLRGVTKSTSSEHWHCKGGCVLSLGT